MDQLQEYLESYYQGKVTIEEQRLLSGGACQDNFFLRLRVQDQPKELVLRTDRGGSLLSSLSRVDEFSVAKLAFDHDVLTPEPLWKEENQLEPFGHPFVFFKKIDGKTDPRTILKDKSLAKVREHLPNQLAAELVKIHNILYKDNQDFSALKTPSNTEDYAMECVSELEKELDKLSSAHPVLEMALSWMKAHLPKPEPLVLVHGDYRLGNFMVTETGLTGILDWEFAHWGDAAEDIAWVCLRDWRFGSLKKECAGLTSRADFYSEYAKLRSEVDPERVRFWEVMGNARWALGTLQQTMRVLEGKARGIELLAIGRRCCEMEYEILRLIHA